ncbi:MAG: MBL fold metallo-hydrolase [Candidatus Goldbacteria bacterium]|nr:MBL fold metallo-hydrolase [Candidatus Goldiibacteriota bacterium]
MTAEQVIKNMTWFHHDSFMLKLDEKIIYIDPFKIETGPAADYILITHEHYDHCSPEDIKKVSSKNTVIVCTGQSAEKLKGYNLKIVKPGDSILLGDIKVETVPAYNNKKPFHPKKDGKAGYIINYKGARIYHMGDTDLIDEMKNVGKISVVLVPVSGTFVMTAKEAALAVDLIKPEIAVPMHYGLIVGNKNDGEEFKKFIKDKNIKVFIPEEKKVKNAE